MENRDDAQEIALVLVGVAAVGLLASSSGCGRPRLGRPHAGRSSGAGHSRQAGRGGAANRAARPRQPNRPAPAGARCTGTFKFVGTPPAPGKLTRRQGHRSLRQGQRHPGQLAVGRPPTAASPTSCSTPGPSAFTNRPSRCRPTTRPRRSCSTRKECMFLTHVLACQVNQKDGHEEQRSDRPQHQDRSAPRACRSTRTCPPARTWPIRPRPKRHFRRRSRAASIPGCRPTCCRARTSTSP